MLADSGVKRAHDEGALMAGFLIYTLTDIVGSLQSNMESTRIFHERGKH